MIGRRPVGRWEASVQKKAQAHKASTIDFGDITFLVDGGPEGSKRGRGGDQAPADGGAAGAAAPKDEPSSYGELLLAILPAEIVSAYLVINPLVANPNINFGFLVLGLLLTVVFALGAYWKDPLQSDPQTGKPVGRPSKYTHVGLAAVAFVLWAWVLGAPGLKLLPHWFPPGSLTNQDLRSAFVAVFTLLVAPAALMLAGQPWKVRSTPADGAKRNPPKKP